MHTTETPNTIPLTIEQVTAIWQLTRTLQTNVVLESVPLFKAGTVEVRDAGWTWTRLVTPMGSVV